MHFVHFRAIIYFSRWLRTHCAYSASVLCDKYDKEITNFEEDKTDTHKYGMVGVVLKLVAEMVRMVVVLMVAMSILMFIMVVGGVEGIGVFFLRCCRSWYWSRWWGC